MKTQKTLDIVINALEDVKGENILTIDTQKLSPLFSKIVICSGNSSRQVIALAHHVITDLKKHDIPIIGTEGNKGGEWVLVDCGNIVVHIMLPQVRSYYDLETLWSSEN